MKRKMIKQGLEVKWWLTELRQHFEGYNPCRIKIIPKTAVCLHKIELLVNAVLKIVMFQKEEDKEMRPSERI